MAETIEYCLRNVDGTTRKRLLAAGAGTDADAAADESATVVEQRCLQRCGECYREDFLVVDGAVETGASHAALLSAHGVSEP
ncbi:MAG: DUF1450 domain-containing protein [Haloarculaceae archaeon]